MPKIDRLAGRRIGLLGYGRDGRATAAALLRRDPGLNLTVLVERGKAETDLPLISGPFDERLQNFEILIRSPGVPVDHRALVAARQTGVEVVNPASIWLAERGGDLTVVGVTGSKGKSTTASLLAHLLRGQGRDVLLAGNIGVPLLDHLETTSEIAVLELSSYQLADLQGRIDLGLFTRLFPEHLDWHGSEQAYLAAKLRLAELLDGRPLLINGRDDRLVRATASVGGRVMGNRTPAVWRDGDRLMLDRSPLCPEGTLPLIGRHNLDNAALALQAAILLGHEGPALAGSLASFRALPHRLEPVAVINGVRYINDSISTNPWSARAALEALSPAPVILIAGGHARTTCWQPVLEWTENNELAGLIALPDNGCGLADAYRRQRARQGDPRAHRIHQADQLDDAVELAAGMAPEGGVVLLSPGAPSFGRYRDFEQRGEHFRRAVRALANP
ncbi:MAG TPA: UDP-N-acetylmuramoyl-L-alanine--D-glutamate ligase [Wenzhouxiangella sp.]|nr:UDP-N-acetylmuramoyl-L-alanine--D-glutamate ligase [Wenzhouxiangella sp.]